MSSYFLFVVDTDHYAGNFWRQLCGYVVGQTDGYGGEKAAEVFSQEVPQNPLVARDGISLVINQPTGDNGLMAPCEIYPNPAWFNNGLGGEFRYDDPGAKDKALKAYLAYCVEEAEKSKKNIKTWNWSEESQERQLKRDAERIEKARAATEPNHFPAYRSVAIFLEHEPSKEQLLFLRNRTFKFVDYCRGDRFLPDDLGIEGFRLLEIRTEEIELRRWRADGEPDG